MGLCAGIQVLEAEAEAVEGVQPMATEAWALYAAEGVD